MFVNGYCTDCITGIKDNVRLQSIIRHSLQPVENPDTVLMIPTADGQDEENWADSEGSSIDENSKKGTSRKERKGSFHCYVK